MQRITMQDFSQDAYTVSRSYLSMHNRGEGGWREGIFNHAQGLVRVFEANTTRHRATSMFFIHNGFSHHRKWETTWGDKTIARLAREFVEEITSEQ